MGESRSAGVSMPVPWGREPNAETFDARYPTEFKTSSIPDCGKGWYAKTRIPAGVQLRRVSTADGTLIRIGSERELVATGWGLDAPVNYGIGHWCDGGAAIYFLSPGTAVNHASSGQPSIGYKHLQESRYDGSMDFFMELWSLRDIEEGEEMFCDYGKDYGPCAWFDELQQKRGNVPLSQVPAFIEGAAKKTMGEPLQSLNPNPAVISEIPSAARPVAEKTMAEPLQSLNPNPAVISEIPSAARPVPWGRKVNAETFDARYPTEFQTSSIPGGGKGWYALAKIPAGVQLRRVSTVDGSLIRIGSERELVATGWGLDAPVNYGIGHWCDAGAAIYFLSPGTAVNHASSGKPSVGYRHMQEARFDGSLDFSMELWSLRDIEQGEEMFCDYGKDYGPCAWFDELQLERGNIPLSQLPAVIERAAKKGAAQA